MSTQRNVKRGWTAAARGFQHLERVSARWSGRLGDRGPADDGRENAGYGQLWRPHEMRDAMLQIYNTENPDAFEQGGRLDADRLSPYFDETSAVLDFGCGIGRVSKYVAPRCNRLWTVDASQRMLDLAADRLSDYTNVTYALCNDVTIPDVPNGSVDLAYSFLVLQHVEREDAFLLLEELRRVLQPNGTLLVTFPNLLSDVYLASFLEYARARASGQRNRARAYTPEEVARLLPAAGFTCDLNVGTEIYAVCRPSTAQGQA